MNIFIAKFRWGRADLASAVLIKETEKTFLITDDVTQIFNNVGYLPNRLLKDKYHVFTTLEDALVFLIDMAKKDVKASEAELRYSRAQLQNLGKIYEDSTTTKDRV